MPDRVCAADGCDRPFASKGWCRMHAERVRRNGHPDLVGRGPGRPMLDRLWEKVDRSGGPDACWPFGGRLSPEGYGRIRTGGGGSPTIGAHRAAFLSANPDADPEVIDHRCHDPKVCAGGPTCPHRRCCNPAHLAASTVAENSSVGRQVVRLRDRCANGHEYDEANTYIYYSERGRPIRRCRRCNTEKVALRKKVAMGGTTLESEALAGYRARVSFTDGSIARVVTARRRYVCSNHLSMVELHYIEPGDQYVRNSLPPHNPDIGNEGWLFLRLCLDCCPVEHDPRVAQAVGQ